VLDCFCLIDGWIDIYIDSIDSLKEDGKDEYIYSYIISLTTSSSLLTHLSPLISSNQYSGGSKDPKTRKCQGKEELISHNDVVWRCFRWRSIVTGWILLGEL
jgi:hypothetical protein